MSELLRRLIPQARSLITKETFRDLSFGSLDGYIEDISRPIDLTPLVRVVHTAMKMFPPRDEESDRWLAPRVHASLRLFRTEAADQGIWDYLSVFVLRDYVLWRVAGKDGSLNDVNQIIGPFRHQAVAWLWWAAELSRNGADYHPTEEVFSSRDAVNYLTNVEAFHNRPAALAYIRFIGQKSGDKPIKQRAIETGKTLNHVLTTVVLDSFAPDSGSDMHAQEQWIAKAPDVTLMDSALPIGPNEPQVPEEKIYAVEQLLERMMEEHRWHDVVDWSEQWIAEAHLPQPVDAGLPIISSPDGNGSKETIEKDVPTKDVVTYARFVEALRDDLGVEPSDQTRDLFEKISADSDPSHNPKTFEGLAQGKEIADARLAPRVATSPDVASVRGDEIAALGEPALALDPESHDAPAEIVETAERVYEALSPAQQTLARRIFLQLTELGEGTADTARRATLEELIPRPQNALPVDALLKMLSDAHLIRSDEAAVRLADEALIREWKRLSEWLDEDREGLRLQRHLAHAAQEWEIMQRDPSVLYRGARLAQALEWAKAHGDEISARAREFLDASEKAAERAGQSLAEAAMQRAAMQWRRRTLYLVAAMISVPIIVAVVVYFVR